jgi:hypothetical protein
MISMILYGRNDSYGYNLHKRAALSLNCMAEILSDPEDEVIFIDYNTPDDYPTFPEAIQDTLTERAKERLRILRVRPPLHARFSDRTHLFVLEPVARNIGVRRSNPNNRWILSTNTDMIFVPHDGTSLSRHVEDLARGFYHLPRFEIPETLWETFDRRDALGTIKALRHWGRTAHLNEIVLGFPIIRFDGPGDFQLIGRDDLVRIHGFDENMLLGWHVDSNVAKRLHLLHGKTGDLLEHLYGYHCDHTRQVTPAHRADSVENDWHHYFDHVEQTNWETDADTWGAPNDDIEEIRLKRTRNSFYLEALTAVIPQEMATPTTADYLPCSYNMASYDAPHVLPFLADAFANAPRGIKIGWIGANPDMFRLFAELWKKMEFGGEIMVAAEIADQICAAKAADVKVLDFDRLAAEADGFVFDFAVAGGTLMPADSDPLAEEKKRIIAKFKPMFLHFVRVEQQRLVRGEVPRRVVCVNTVHNDFERLVGSLVGVARTPFSSRIRQGFVKAPDWKHRIWYKIFHRKRRRHSSAGSAASDRRHFADHAPT